MSDAPSAANAPIALSPEELAAVCTLLYRWTGMIFGENKRYYIERRITERMKRTNITTAKAYLGFIGVHLAEREALINAFTINETYFYREEHQLAALSRDILPELVRTKRPGDLVRIWSMPCSTGEEAYSIALWLLENWPLVDAYNVEIVGSDIDTGAIAKAQDGHFAERALARLPDTVRESYFEPEHGHRRRIIQDLRESVRFVAANIIDASSLSGLGLFDVILCRNLLIYFDDSSRLIAANNLFDALNPGGTICLGHSESMGRISDRFTLSRLPDAIVYRKP
ncbi:protein-glutamate O-methyltransferase CheR (plasmid) [Novosphingobium resinovorum]|uniref:CheR family methyltransferase n=1 Tax=Sphingomonadaceae TaxID=41297 RepID=UPI00027CC976|nr:MULTISPECIES: protein-glutamate O-methyltransferase CheR [Sphingomonadaceae]EJU13588.1 CheR-type MCP methyltransferase [Sphingomonas sp. LH128]MBF7015559.1 protein-glutamate O-methyltransferase CheR [Novosphingobium sp. HR1a]WJM30235.1 protein-glutamate O-methyltransferase CheR [Novosphingobium resinovorum]